jgi:hypothetical protein
MATQFPSLDKGLSFNPKLSQIIYANLKPGYLKILDRLFYDLYDAGCKGVDTKVSEVYDLLRFQSLVSELEFARYFATKKWQVELLSNNAFQGRKAPDMLVTSGSREYFIEVKNIGFDEEEYNFGTRVAEALNAKGMSFMVVIKSSSLLSRPAYKFQSKEQKEASCVVALDEFNNRLKGISSTTEELKISTTIADVELHPTQKGQSYLGIRAMKEVISEPSEYGERIKYDILQKSGKREDWAGPELDKLYIVAIDDFSWFFNIDRYNIELFGPTTCFYPPLPVPNPTIDATIQNALNLGWKDYLVRMGILRKGWSVIEDQQRGMFYTEARLRNVTAVLVRNQSTLYLLANPFAENRINNTSILAELADCSIGWQ